MAAHCCQPSPSSPAGWVPQRLWGVCCTICRAAGRSLHADASGVPLAFHLKLPNCSCNQCRAAQGDTSCTQHHLAGVPAAVFMTESINSQQDGAPLLRCHGSNTISMGALPTEQVQGRGTSAAPQPYGLCVKYHSIGPIAAAIDIQACAAGGHSCNTTNVGDVARRGLASHAVRGVRKQQYYRQYRKAESYSCTVPEQLAACLPIRLEVGITEAEVAAARLRWASGAKALHTCLSCSKSSW